MSYMNTEGSRMWMLTRRYILSNSATDINECDEGSDTCQVGVEECVNTQGGHTCQPKPCPIGRKRHPSNPRRCTGEHFQRFEHR